MQNSKHSDFTNLNTCSLYKFGSHDMIQICVLIGNKLWMSLFPDFLALLENFIFLGLSKSIQPSYIIKNLPRANPIGEILS